MLRYIYDKWYDMIPRNTIWYDGMLCGVMWNEIVWFMICDTIWYDMVRYDKMCCDVIGYDVIWYYMKWLIYDMIYGVI